MGDQEFNITEFFISRINDIGLVHPLEVQEKFAKELYDAIQSRNAKGGIMKGDRDSRFDEIVDVINDARLNGLLPVEISTHDDNQMPPFWFDILDDSSTCYHPPRDFIVTIRFRRQ